MLKPSKKLQNTITAINKAFGFAGMKYWLSFGGLYAIIKNNGIIPDGDFDLCTNYGQGFEKIQKAFKASPARYGMSKALLSDTDKLPLYCSFGSEAGFPHICLSFWYEHKGIAYYCHDQKHEVEGVGVPKRGYWFRGVPVEAIRDFKMVEWPGVPQTAKIRVPRYPGVMLDNMYPDWAYKIQKYNISNSFRVEHDKMDSYYHGGACSPFEVHVETMKQFDDEKWMKDQFTKSHRKWDIKLKTI